MITVGFSAALTNGTKNFILIVRLSLKNNYTVQKQLLFR